MKTLTLLGVATIAVITGAGTASAASPTGEPVRPLTSESDSPTSRTVNWGVNADGWAVNIHNNMSGDYKEYTMTYKPAPLGLDNIVADHQVRGNTTGYAKGHKTLIGSTPADADAEYDAEFFGIHFYLRADYDGTTHHSCNVTHTAMPKKCTITQSNIADPIEVSIDWG